MKKRVLTVMICAVVLLVITGCGNSHSITNEKENNNQNGEIMIEAAIIFPFTIFILIGMISLGFLWCQQAMVYTIACETASYVGENYKYTNLDTINKLNITNGDLKDVKMYRTSIAMTGIQNSRKEKANEYVINRNKLTSFSPDKDAKTELSFKKDNVGRLHVIATVSVESNIIFSGALKFLGVIEDIPDFRASAEAECIDLTGYVGQVGLVSYLDRELEETKIAGIVDNIDDTVNTIKNTVNKLTSLVQHIVK